MAKVTSSATRSKRKPAQPKPVTKGQNPQRANRQRVSQAQLTNDGGRGSNAGSAKVTQGRGGTPAGARGARPMGTADVGPKGPVGQLGQRTGNPPAKPLAGAKGARPMGTADVGPKGPVGGLGQRTGKPPAKPQAPKPTARTGGRGGNTGTVRATGDTTKFPWMEKYKPTDFSPQQKKNLGKVQQGLRGAAAVAGGARSLGVAAIADTIKPRPVNANEAVEVKKAHAKQNQANAEYKKKNYTPDAKGFDNAFRDARRAGSKNFTWQGKKYTTEMN